MFDTLKLLLLISVMSISTSVSAVNKDKDKNFKPGEELLYNNGEPLGLGGKLLNQKEEELNADIKQAMSVFTGSMALAQIIECVSGSLLIKDNYSKMNREHLKIHGRQLALNCIIAVSASYATYKLWPSSEGK